MRYYVNTGLCIACERFNPLSIPFELKRGKDEIQDQHFNNDSHSGAGVL